MWPQLAGELEHADAVLAEHGAQFVVGDDGAFVLRVLQVVGLDVVPEFFQRLGAGDGLGADEGGQGGAGGLACGGFAWGFGGSFFRRGFCSGLGRGFCGGS